LNKEEWISNSSSNSMLIFIGIIITIIDALFFVQAYRGLKPCTSLLENVSLRVPTRHVRDFSTFSVCPSKKHCPSAPCVYAANAVGKDLDIFAIGAVSLNHVL
jgi:hypothetical protein